MERDYGREIDELRSSINEMMNLIRNELRAEAEAKIETKTETIIEEVKNQTPQDREQNDHLMAIADKYAEQYRESGGGKLAVVGSWTSVNHQSDRTSITWSSDGLDINELLDTIKHPKIEDILVCIGSSTKLSILLALINKPMSVSQLVEECKFGSTGQVYHHLQPLISSGMVKESEDRGYYSVEGGTFIGLVEVFAGMRHWLPDNQS
jgi:Bacterial regulatory protein, arsR family.